MNILQIKKSSFRGFWGLLLVALISLNACSDWLDIVPDGVPTIEMAFNSREEAMKYLATCYSYVQRTGNLNEDPAMLGGDELWTHLGMHNNGLTKLDGFMIALGMQNATAPIYDSWSNLYQGIRNCNIFIENAGNIPDMPEWERAQWIAEATVLKALYHFQLVRMYGPVPIVRENIPISADLSAVKAVRNTVDECFDYIEELLDEAIDGYRLPMKVQSPSSELGHITRPVAYAIKAKAMVTAASPLFNGNTDQARLCNPDGTQLFNQAVLLSKWEKAMKACQKAIEACLDEKAGIALYEYDNRGLTPKSDFIATQLSLREAYTERWNREIIWALWINARTDVRHMAPTLDPQWISNSQANQNNRDCQVPLKILDKFYTNHGVPLAEDNTRDISKLLVLRTAIASDKLCIKPAYTTVDMHFDREPRFYAWLGFDGGTWYGAGRDIETQDLWAVNTRAGGLDWAVSWKSLGTIPKKLIPHTNMLTSTSMYAQTKYPIPIMRLSDLFLLYAEAINEFEGPNGSNSVDLFYYIDEVRKRAGLEGVKDSWNTYTNNPKYNTQPGMRDIIRQERTIELCFEGQRFWDLRRWKTIYTEYQTPIAGWNTMDSEAELFYQVVPAYKQTFNTRDYFWPIKNNDIVKNPNLVQNIGW